MVACGQNQEICFPQDPDHTDSWWVPETVTPLSSNTSDLSENVLTKHISFLESHPIGHSSSLLLTPSFIIILYQLQDWWGFHTGHFQCWGISCVLQIKVWLAAVPPLEAQVIELPLTRMWNQIKAILKLHETYHKMWLCKVNNACLWWAENFMFSINQRNNFKKNT